jgi:RNA polymerase sigma-70 factor (ECF subfamily)
MLTTPPPGLPPEDPLLLGQRLKQGDETALRAVIQLLGPRVAGGLKKRHPTLHAEDIEDVLSDASLRLWVSRGQFDPARGSLASWFFIIADNAARDLLRKEARRAELTADLDWTAVPDRAECGAGPDTTLPWEGTLAAILGALPKVDHLILTAYAQAGGEGPWAAGLVSDTGLSAGAIRVRCHRLKKKIRKQLLAR